MRFATVLLTLLALGGCASPRRLTVAAASNLTGAFDEIGRAFTEETGIEIIFTYGATTALARQVEGGAPVDLFAAADAEHVDALVASGNIAPETRAIYARGLLALWAPDRKVDSLNDLAGDEVKFVAIAQPDLAPYGHAAVEALHAAGIWDAVQPKLVFANTISQTRQLAATGNADAAFTAYSLVFREPGSVLRVDEKLYAPLEQVLGVVANSARESEARTFAAFVMGAKGQAVLLQNGYLAAH
jgi:molybdate transport system substrate-binding protein